jgi:hypothetical protein
VYLILFSAPIYWRYWEQVSSLGSVVIRIQRSTTFGEVCTAYSLAESRASSSAWKNWPSARQSVERLGHRRHHLRLMGSRVTRSRLNARIDVRFAEFSSSWTASRCMPGAKPRSCDAIRSWWAAQPGGRSRQDTGCHGAGAALALQAVADGDARWFALNRKVKLPVAAGGASGHGSAPWLSIWAECRLDFKTMHHGQRKSRPAFPSHAPARS